MSTFRPGIATVLGGAFSALLFLALEAGSLGGMILFFMAQLPLFMVALGFGPGLASAAAVWAFAMLATSLSLTAGLEYLILVPIPVLVVAASALRGPKPNPGFMILALTAVVVTAFVAADVVNRGITGGLEGRLRVVVGQALAQFQHGNPMLAAPGMADRIASLVPGVCGGFLLIVSVCNGVLAQGALGRFAWNRWAPPRMASLTLPRWVSAAFAAALAVGALGSGEVGFLAENLAIILATPLMFAGLAVVHEWTDRHPTYWVVPWLVYVMSFVTGWPLPVMVALGIVEQWFGLRRNQARPTEEKTDG